MGDPWNGKGGGGGGKKKRTGGENSKSVESGRNRENYATIGNILAF